MVSADQLAREAVRPGSPALAELVVLFGADILTADGHLDRQAVAEIVFADPAARRKLEAVTHPAIARLAEERLDELRAAGQSLVIYEAPLLFEAGAAGRVDLTLVVLVEPAVQLERVMRRDRCDAGAARARIQAQWPQADKVAKADFVVDNSADFEIARRAVSALHGYLVGNIPPG